MGAVRRVSDGIIGLISGRSHRSVTRSKGLIDCVDLRSFSKLIMYVILQAISVSFIHALAKDELTSGLDRRESRMHSSFNTCAKLE